MKNPLNDSPYNTARAYVMEKTIDGCEIYMPVNTNDTVTMNVAKLNLKYWLDQQYEKPDPFNFDDPFTTPPTTVA